MCFWVCLLFLSVWCVGGFGRFSRIMRGSKRRAYNIFHACPIYSPLCHCKRVWIFLFFHFLSCLSIPILVCPRVGIFLLVTEVLITGEFCLFARIVITEFVYRVSRCVFGAGPQIARKQLQGRGCNRGMFKCNSCKSCANLSTVLQPYPRR